MKENNSLMKGAFILGLSTFIAKLLGAFYKIPLTNLLGGYGIGLYQMIFPVYCLLLDFSGSAVPSALSRLIAKNKDNRDLAKRLLINSIRLFLFLSIIFSVLMALFSKRISTAQGNENASIGYLFLSPAILFVSIISCFRGYFQGFMDMKPTALSQLVEQTIKLIFGLILVNIFLPNIPLCVGGATLAITISELIALIILVALYKKRENVQTTSIKNTFFCDSKIIIKTTFPITLVGIMIPLSQVVDSFLTINILSRYTDNATTLYGLLSGIAITIINLPVSICYGIATVAIPSVSASDEKQRNSNIKKALALTLLVAIPCAIFLFFFAPFTINLLFRNLDYFQKETAIRLLKITSPCVILLSLLQTSNAILIGKGKLYKPVFSLFIGITVKTILSVLLLNIKRINIYGGAIAIIACYFIVCLINLIMIFKKRVKHESKRNFSGRYIYQE